MRRALAPRATLLAALAADVALAPLAACGDDGAATCSPGIPDTGDIDGHPEPLAAGPTEARAGRITAAAQLPATTHGLETWKVGDYVLANDRVALVIEDVGPSDLYDPWGGRPVGMAFVRGGAMVQPADFGEIFLLVGRATVVTESVTVVNDGTGGAVAVIRARGRLAQLPFLDPLLQAILGEDLGDIEAAIDYSLAPGADVVDVTMHLDSRRTTPTVVGAVLHGFMFTDRMRSVVPGVGYTDAIADATWVELVDDDGASFAYRAADGPLGGSIARSGFIGALNDPFTIEPCAVTTRAHARIVIGGPGLDGLVAARARVDGEALRTIEGSVSGVPSGITARVHATATEGGYLTRAPVDVNGNFRLRVPADGPVTLTAITSTGVVATTDVAPGGTTAAIALPALARLTVDRVVDDAGVIIPARVQVLPVAGGPPVTEIPASFGEATAPSGRHVVRFHDGAPMSIALVPGRYRLVVSRGPEYELFERELDLVAGSPVTLNPLLERVIDTAGVQCGDFHIHTLRSNDADDDATYKVQSAMADGVEILVRSDHEWVGDFQPLIEQHAWDRWAMGVGSIEMTSFELWGHMGVFPLAEDPAAVNHGAPAWQTFPSAEEPDAPLVTRGPVEVFDAVRARPERPTIIINHPQGSTNYFGYVGLDPTTGLVASPEYWDDEFALVEVFNDSGWRANRGGTIASWFALLNSGRRVFAVGSSDSHSVRGSPVGYPRTCIRLGTDDPQAIDGERIRDELVAGHATVSGGVYVRAAVGSAGPGDTATTGAVSMVEVSVQAASWIDVDTVDVVVDGEVADTFTITAEDADPQDPAVRWRRTVAVDVAAAGSWVVVAAHGDGELAPVHPGRAAFGVTNPIFLAR
jgi:hypothetical protein